MNPDHLRAFVGRDWSLKSASKRRYWADRHNREGAMATLAAASSLRANLCAIRPGWPGKEDRAADLRHHLDFNAKLRLVADVLADH